MFKTPLHVAEDVFTVYGHVTGQEKWEGCPGIALVSALQLSCSESPMGCQQEGTPEPSLSPREAPL